MSKLPTTKRNTPTVLRQKARLVRWLREWEIERSLSEAARDAAKPSALPKGVSPTRVAAREGEERPREGQIRLLYPETEATRDRPVYVALLRREGQGLLAAPFSRLSEPAFRGEWLTGRRAVPLRVLCLWNAAVLSEESLRRSWVVSRLSVRERGDAEAVLRSARGGAPLDAKLERRCGPPLRHPLDPRHEYREQEHALLAGMTARRWSDRVRDGTESSPWPTAGDDFLPLAKAAEAAAVYGAHLTYEVVGREARIDVTLESAASICVVKPLDRRGAATSALAGCRLQGRWGGISQPLKADGIHVPADLVYGGFEVLAENGEALPVRLVR